MTCEQDARDGSTVRHALRSMAHQILLLHDVQKTEIFRRITKFKIRLKKIKNSSEVNLQHKTPGASLCLPPNSQLPTVGGAHIFAIAAATESRSRSRRCLHPSRATSRS